MTEDTESILFENAVAANEFIRALDDAMLKAFVTRALVVVIVRCQRGERPKAPFDVLFFAKAMAQFYEQKDDLIREWNGEDLRWWPDDDK